MLKNTLIKLGLIAAPTPYKKYFALSQIGILPALGFFAWKNRDRLASMFHRSQQQA